MINMKSNTMIKSTLLILFIALTLPGLAQDDPKMIFNKALDQMMTDHMELSMDIETTDEKGQIKKKSYDILMAKFGEVEKTRMVMQKPERAKGVTVVITNSPGETGLIEVYTPANGKVRKMKATPENMDQVGYITTLSDFQPIAGVEGKIQAMQIDTKDVEENTQTRMQVLQIAHRPDLKEEDFAIQEISN